MISASDALLGPDPDKIIRPLNHSRNIQHIVQQSNYSNSTLLSTGRFMLTTIHVGSLWHRDLLEFIGVVLTHPDEFVIFPHTV